MPQTGWDGDDWQDVRPRRGRVLRQDDHGHDRQQGIKRHGGSTGNGLRQSRFTVFTRSRTGTNGRGITRVSDGSGNGKGILRWRYASRRPHRSVMAENAVVVPTGKLLTNHRCMGNVAVVSTGKPQIRGARDETVADSSFKRFVTFYFTNFPAQLSNFYLRKGFEVCGILEEVVVPSKRNVYGEVYDFVRFSKVRDVRFGLVISELMLEWLGLIER